MRRVSFTLRQLVILGVVLVALFGLVGFAIYAQSRKNVSPSTAGKAEALAVATEVGKLMMLPDSEEPVLATVTDKSKLDKQAVFANAENNDKILIYSKAQKVIVYRPSARKIVDVAPLVSDKRGSQYITGNITILNGTSMPNLSDKLEQSIRQAFPNITVTQKSQAPREFPETILIDLTKKKQTLSEQMADTLGVKTGRLPLGISQPEGEFLLIIGKDRQ